MYIDRVPNRTSPPAILIRESYREDGKVRKRTLANITNLPPGLVEGIRGLLKGGTVSSARLEDGFDIVRSRPHGHVHAVLGALRACGIDRIIGPKRAPERDLAVAMIVDRIIGPRSKYGTARGLSAERGSSSLPFCLGLDPGVDEDDLYAAMDWLLGRQDRIERSLARRHFRNGGMVFWDLTSVWMEGRTCPLAAYGHSRDGKRGRLQIEFGLLCDAEGWPVAVEAFKGSTADPKTVLSQVEALRRRFRLKRVVMVGDRGMLTDARIREDVAPAGCGWISALRAPAIRRLVENGAFQPTLFDDVNLAEISCPELYPGERLIVCRNPFLAEDRARRRNDLLDATERLLEAAAAATRRERRPLRGIEKITERVTRAADKHRMRKHFSFTITEDGFAWQRNRQRIADEAALDGFYIVRTSVPAGEITAADAVAAYKSLGKVERAFRTFKLIGLRVRPIHHRLERRVRAHLLICMLAYYVEHHMRQRLEPLLFDDPDGPERDDIVARARPSAAAKKKKAAKLSEDGHPLRSLRDLLERLSAVSRMEVRPRIPGAKPFVITSRPEPDQQKAFELLGLKS